jgi:tetratricopeptide (TPR) repeat protein
VRGNAGASSSSSSSSSSDDDATAADPNATAGAAPGLKDAGSSGNSPTPGRHILHRVNPIGTKLQTTDEREQEDLDVAHFYIDTGDLQGAYMRSQDAVKIAPDDPDAHFALAVIALKLNKKDEAIAEYTAVLKLDPTEKQAKDAHKALAKLKP